MPVISVSLPDSTVAQLDRTIDQGGYAGRSELVRAALREFFQAHAPASSPRARRTATLTVVYAEGAERRIAELRHDFGRNLKSMMHGHAGDRCVDLYMLEGPAQEIQVLSDRLRAVRDAQSVHVAYTDVPETP